MKAETNNSAESEEIYVLALVASTENMPIYFYLLKPHFYIVKLGFTGVYIIFLISAQNLFFLAEL